VTLLEAPEPPSRLPSNSLLADSLARLVSAATVEAVLAVELAVELELLLALATELAGVAAAWLLLMLPIDITVPIATAGIRDIGRDSWNLSDRICIDGCFAGRFRPDLFLHPRRVPLLADRERR